MQLDKTRLVVRERSYVELLDLALLVIRHHALVWAALLVIGTAPMIALNAWLLYEWVQYFVEASLVGSPEAESGFGYVCVMVAMILVEAPLATAPITLMLGQVMFQDRLDARQLVSDLVGSLPQLLAAVLYRFVLLLPVLAVLYVPEDGQWVASLIVITGLIYLVRVAGRPHLSEIILLERNSWRRRNRDDISTARRNKDLHQRYAGELIGHWLTTVFLAGCLSVCGWYAIRAARGVMTNRWLLDETMWSVYLQVAIWLVLGYFTVVRYLGYLNLRIRTEGWEVELALRAEAARLEQKLA